MSHTGALGTQCNLSHGVTLKILLSFLRRTARACLILIPLFGVQYIIMPFQPDGDTFIYDIFRAVLISYQVKRHLQGCCHILPGKMSAKEKTRAIWYLISAVTKKSTLKLSYICRNLGKKIAAIYAYLHDRRHVSLKLIKRQNRESTEGYSKSKVRKNNDKFGKQIGINK